MIKSRYVYKLVLFYNACAQFKAMAGRPLDEVWSCFESLASATGPKAKCRGCKASHCAIVSRMKLHALKCAPLHRLNLWTSSGPPSAAPVATSEPAREPMEVPHAPDSAAPPPEVFDVPAPLPISPRVEPPLKKQKQSSLFVMKTSADELVALNEQLCNSPFVFVYHPEFKKFVAMLRPGCVLTDSRKIGGSILDSLYETAVEVRARIEGSMVTLSVDGWSNVRNEPVIGVSISCDPYLVATVDTMGHPHTAEYLVGVTKDQITMVQVGFSHGANQREVNTHVLGKGSM